MKKPIALTILCLALALFAVACGGDDDESSGDNGDKNADTVGPSGKSGKANVQKVDMKDTKYVPAQVTVPAGTTIQWTNSDSVAHTVTKGDGPGPKFDSKNIDQGDSFERNFPDKGTINYFCMIHPNQKGTITVQ
jgi:plastocyanin